MSSEAWPTQPDENWVRLCDTCPLVPEGREAYFVPGEVAKVIELPEDSANQPIAFPLETVSVWMKRNSGNIMPVLGMPDIEYLKRGTLDKADPCPGKTKQLLRKPKCPLTEELQGSIIVRSVMDMG